MSKDYWAERQAKAQTNLTNKGVAATEKQLKKYYSSSMKKVLGQFEKTYDKLLSSVSEGKQPTPADLYKLDKYWQMQGQLKNELQKLGDKQASLLSKQFEKQFKNIYDSIALKDSGYFGTIDNSTVQQMINQIWCADGKSWSQRIWTNTDKLQQTLNDNLIDCVLTGKKTSELKKTLQNDFQASYTRADTIVRTEMAYIQTQAAQQRYKDLGIQEVEIWADEDERRCDMCGKLHEKRYKVNEQVPIPAHPRCRCCVIPVVDQLTSLNKDDIIIGKSLGAAARNYPVKAPDSNQHYKFVEGTSITKIKVIMGSGTKHPLRDKYKIAIKFGITNPDTIQKLRGEGFVMVDGKKRKAELHWYEAGTDERYEFKIKEYLDES